MVKTFEDKMNDLESLINDLENGNINLDDSINKYTEAMKLVKECDLQLKQVEEKISKIILENGNIEDFDVESN